MWGFNGVEGHGRDLGSTGEENGNITGVEWAGKFGDLGI